MNRLIPFDLKDGLTVESVWYPYRTLCISSQAGCRVGCPFCASGRKGLVRNLTAAELLEQSLCADADRITVSGIGEPLDNYDAVAEFISVSKLPVSVTTTGNSPKLKDLLMLNHNGVMISIHSGTETTHKRLIPNTRGLHEIFADIEDVWSGLSVRAKKRIGFNYLLVEGINDSLDEIDAYLKNVGRFPQAVTHLLRLNPVEKSPYKSPPDEKFNETYEYIRSKGINVRRANRWRNNELGGCGTLWLKNMKENS